MEIPTFFERRGMGSMIVVGLVVFALIAAFCALIGLPFLESGWAWGLLVSVGMIGIWLLAREISGFRAIKRRFNLLVPKWGAMVSSMSSEAFRECISKGILPQSVVDFESDLVLLRDSLCKTLKTELNDEFFFLSNRKSSVKIMVDEDTDRGEKEI